MLIQLSKKIKSFFLYDERGVSAIEFAFVAPILLSIYLGLSELTLGMIASRRSSHLAATVGDLTAQSEVLTNANIADIFEIGESLITPSAAGKSLQIRISNVTMSSTNQATIDWSDGSNIVSYSKGQVIPFIDTTQLAVGDSLIMTEVFYKFDSPIGNFLPISQTYDDIFFHHPRGGKAVERKAS